MLADIIVRGKDQPELTRRCINSIFTNTEAPYRLIYVDDGSRVAPAVDADITVNCVASSGAVTATNMGLGCSLALHDTEYVIVMDNDTEIPEGDRGWLDRMVRELEQYGPQTAAVGATTNYANPPQHILAAPQTYTADWDGGHRENPAVVWFVSFCVMLRKSIVRQMGLWDQRYNPGNWEDTDYAMALRCAGYQVRVARSVYVKHRGHRTYGPKLKELLTVNRGKFLKKWGPGRCWDMGLLSNADVVSLAQERQKRGEAAL